MSMIVANQAEALCVAVEMEKRAIRVYERALMLVQDTEVRAGLARILGEERTHLRRFSQMQESCPLSADRERLLLQAAAAQVLFPGGVMELERAKGLDSLEALYAYAMESEKQAVARYADFARKCADECVSGAFVAIAMEESVHLVALRQELEAIREKEGKKP